MRTIRFALAAIAVPAILSAQQANPITTAFKTRILGAHRNVAQAFDSIPASKFDYKPTPAQLTIGYIAQHVASDNYTFCNNFGEMKATLADEDTKTSDADKAKWPKEKLVAKLKDSFAFCAKAIDQVTDASLAETVTMTFGAQSRQTSRANMVLGHALDLADHYSQLANYMRLNNITPPTALPRPGRGGN